MLEGAAIGDTGPPFQVLSSSLCARVEFAQQPVRQLGHGNRLAVQRHAAALDAGQLEQVFDQHAEALGVAEDRFDGVLGARVRKLGVGEPLGESADRRERRLQFVRCVGDEVARTASMRRTSVTSRNTATAPSRSSRDGTAPR
jgi:hypothetical protein